MKGKYVFETKEHITSLGVRSSNVKLIPEHTTVMSFKLTVGRTAITGREMFCNEAIAIFQPKDDRLNGQWLYHALPRAATSVVTDTAVKGATLTPAHLLDVVKNFMLFMQTGGQTIKTVCRYQQYRAVNRAIARLKTGQTRLQHGEHDKRGAAHEQLIKRFKQPLFHAKPEKTDPLAFLVVKSMLLTGFDAPIEGVMYLDRPIREAELLQAIARVNRTGFGKRCGIVVDYYGVAQHLKEALAAYADEDVEGALASLKDEVPVLRDRHLRVVDLFRQRGIDSLEDTEACVEALGSEKLRAEFAVKLKAFLGSLDTVLPRPEGLPYTKDAKKLAYIYARARNRYKDTPVLGKDVGAKVRKLIDDHVISLGIDPKIPPIQLTDAQFDTHVARAANDRAKASEMEHAIRSHIRKHTDEDPVLYRKLSEHLNDILKTLGNRWASIRRSTVAA